jgi:hypothetical protein
MNLENIDREQMIEIKKALNELYANRVIYQPTSDILKKDNDKYKQMDLDLIQKIVNLLE